MAELMDSKEHFNWSKCSCAFNTARDGVSPVFICSWKKEINSWPSKKQDQIPTFLKNVQDEEITMGPVKGNKKSIQKPEFLCNHELCKEILDRLQQLHQNPKHIILKKKQATATNTQGEDCYWELASMYRHSGEYSDSKPSTCPTDTEAAILFKMMKNCKLFDLQDNSVYENIIGVRNTVMHSASYCLTNDELDANIKVMKDFLEAVRTIKGHVCKGTTCSFEQKIKEAELELDKILERKSQSERTKEDFEMMKKAFEIQRNALEYDKRSGTSSGMDSRTLDMLLKRNEEKAQQCTVFITKYEYIYKFTDPVARKHEYEKFLKNDLKEEKQRKDEVKTQKHKQNGATIAGATGGAVAGAFAGPPGAAVGAVVGGIVGAFASLFS